MSKWLDWKQMKRNFKVTFTRNASRWKKKLKRLKKMEVRATMHLWTSFISHSNSMRHNFRSADAQGMYELSKRFFSTWSEKLQPQSIYIYKCLDIYFDACIELSMWDKIPSMGSKMIKIHRYHYFTMSAQSRNETNWSSSRILTS